MKRFNEQTGNKFEKYMSRIENDRNKFGFETTYAETNKKMVSKYHRLSNPKKKLEIRNALIMFNIKLAHEILYKRLNIDTSKEDSIDILQEINLYLIESVDKILKSRTKILSTNLFYLIIGRLRDIRKKYYEYNIRREFILNPDEIVGKEEEEKEDIRNYINKAILREREYDILIEFLNDDISLEMIGNKYGLTRERVRQIKERAIKKIRKCIIK